MSEQLEYCTECLLPNTKPHLRIVDGVCNACINYKNREDVNWKEREKSFLDLISKHRSKDHSNWDCLVPVSGGKDSTYQVIRMVDLGLNPLCVVATTCDLSEIGRRNIENLKRIGVDVIEFTINPIVRAKLNRIGLELTGDISWPEHIAINTIPIKMAVKMGVSLIVWGENSQNEYGGPADAANAQDLTWEWLLQFAGFLGLRVSDVIGMNGISEADMIALRYPEKEELEKAEIKSIFLGHFFPWDGLSNALVAQARGFEFNNKLVEGAGVSYENLDNHQTGIHDYFKFLKFGFGRTTDIYSMHIRRGRMTRAQALAGVKLHEGKFPWTYLGKPLKSILQPLDLTVDEFVRICDQFTNTSIFKTEQNVLLKDSLGNLQKRNYDN